jgi:hypothetical protein
MGVIFATSGVLAVSPAINITVNDSSNGQDIEQISINVTEDSSPVEGTTPSWVANSSITAAQYNAFDDGDGELTDSEIRAGIDTYIENSFAGDNQINGVAFSNSDIRALISGYVSSQF